MSTVVTSPETAIASLPPNLDAAKDREKWRKVTPPERKKQTPEQSRTTDETRMQSPPAPEEPHPSSEDTSRPSNESSSSTIEEEGEESGHHQGAVLVSQRTPSRRGLWDWARAGTGRLSIIGRIPHPEWKGPVTVRNSATASNNVVNGGSIYESHDDFSIPSTTATELDDTEQQRESVAAKLEGLGIVNGNVMSPSFAQTKRSSDELVAAASSTCSPESKMHEDEQWTNGEASTPSAESKDSPPSTPDTPTPQQRKKDSFTDGHETPTTVPVQDQKSIKPQPRRDSHAEAEKSSTKGTLSEETGTDSEATPIKKNIVSEDEPKSNTSAKMSKASNTSGPHHIPKYKIALAANLLSPARSGTATT